MILGGWILFLTLTMNYDYKASGLIMKLPPYSKAGSRWVLAKGFHMSSEDWPMNMPAVSVDNNEQIPCGTD